MDRFSSNRFDHLIAAFLAMEPAQCLISLAQESGGGSITNEVQSFLWEHCISKLVVKSNAASHLYIKNFIKKVIVAVESSGHDVLDVFYEQYAYYMASFKMSLAGFDLKPSLLDDSLLKGNTRVYKSISFLFPDGHSENQSCPRPAKVVIPLKCSVNMLEGDTGALLSVTRFTDEELHGPAYQKMYSLLMHKLPYTYTTMDDLVLKICQIGRSHLFELWNMFYWMWTFVVFSPFNVHSWGIG